MHLVYFQLCFGFRFCVHIYTYSKKRKVYDIVTLDYLPNKNVLILGRARCWLEWLNFNSLHQFHLMMVGPILPRVDPTSHSKQALSLSVHKMHSKVNSLLNVSSSQPHGWGIFIQFPTGPHYMGLANPPGKVRQSPAVWAW